jgi:hypothetical protein
MAHIQLTLLGIPAIIICGNSLTLETYWQRETIGYHLSGIDTRLRIENTLEDVKALEVPELKNDKSPNPSTKADVELKNNYNQGELFK